MTEAQDEGLVSASTRDRSRDAAVAELFRRRREPMARLAYVLTRDAELSDEIVQEAFLKLHARWNDVDNPGAYLRAAVVNACHSHHRHLAVVRRAPVERNVGGSGGVEMRDDQLAAAVARLPFEQRSVLALRYFCDLDDVEIANTLGIGRATVRSRAARALGRLRKVVTP